jgi:hypothetical protein
MKKITKIILIGILASLMSCKNNERVYNIDQEMGTSSDKKVGEKKFIWTETNVTLNEGCELEKFLEDPKTPKLAKELFENKAKNDDKALEYFEKLKSSDKYERDFYFKVITNSYKNADGAYAEGLGYSGLEYIEKNTLDFLNYFENKKCFSENDLKTWVGILMLEFSLEYDNESDMDIVNIFTSKINLNCKNCNSSQKETLKKFSNYLTEEWKIYLTKQ